MKIIFFALIVCSSCGIKGPPLPPLSDDISQKQKSESVTVDTIQVQPKAASGDVTDAKKLEKRKKKR